MKQRRMVTCLLRSDVVPGTCSVDDRGGYRLLEVSPRLSFTRISTNILLTEIEGDTHENSGRDQKYLPIMVNDSCMYLEHRAKVSDLSAKIF